jgi:putative glycosyltransferase (TIGR04372 family)
MFRRVASLIRAQAIKTVDRPSRLFFGPLSYFLLTLPRFPAVVPFVLPMLPDRWLEDGGGKGLCFANGYKLFQFDRPAEAWPWLKRVLQIGRPSTDTYLVGTMCLFHGLGRFRDAMSLFARANEQNLEGAGRIGLKTFPFRVLDNVWARHIGHTATIDYVIKLGILEGRKLEDTIFYVPPGSQVANRFLLEQVARHLRFVEHATDLPFDASAVQAVHYDYLGPRLPDRTTAYFWDIGGRTYKRWHQEGRGALFTLPAETEERGRAALQGAGVPRDAWFVVLHVREGKWEGGAAGLHGIQNADVATYFPAITEITRRGGWVVRMGDPGMRPLPEFANVIDYCHSDLRADWMDVFLGARCRFMVGSTSGPAFIPPIYGVPTVLTNWWPPAQRAWHASDIFIPKMPRRLADDRYLTLSETLAEPYSFCHSRRYLADRGGVRVEENDAETIRAAVEEMLARTDGDSGHGAAVSDLRLRTDRIYEAHGVSGMGQLSCGFLQRHDDLIV